MDAIIDVIVQNGFQSNFADISQLVVMLFVLHRCMRQCASASSASDALPTVVHSGREGFKKLSGKSAHLG